MSDIIDFSPIRALDRDGIPVSGALASFFLSGTTTPQVVYTTAALDMAHPIPLKANSQGVFPPVFSAVALRCVVTDAASNTLPGYPIDPVAAIGTGSGASQVTFEPSASVPATNVQDAIDILGGGVASIPLGVPFAVWDHIFAAPSNAGTAKFIKLTAGLTGVGQYNNGLLGSESVSGTAPNVLATAEILVGPATGETIYLVNSMEAFMRPRTTSGTLQAGEVQGHTHTGTTDSAGAHNHDLVRQSGFGSGPTSRLVRENVANGSDEPTTSAPPHAHGFTTDSTGGDETRPRNVSQSMYLRIV